MFCQPFFYHCRVHIDQRRGDDPFAFALAFVEYPPTRVVAVTRSAGQTVKNVIEHFAVFFGRDKRLGGAQPRGGKQKQ